MQQLLKLITEEYKYDSEEERYNHVIEMEKQGYMCSGQVQRSDDKLMKPNREYYWFAKFSKVM